ncbi:hypothetical protein [Gemmatimonas sp.]|uniref:hypothetical protein n=1 Tax=Gemmatimonas sp. TaxID=1962908 RepID=UPI003DA5C886
MPSRHTGGTVYFAANYLFKSHDRGDSWKTISPDVTRNLNRNQLPMRGSVPPRDALGPARRHGGVRQHQCGQ